MWLDNYPEPGKRPLSSTVPTIVENPDGSFYLAIGGAGGSKIFPSVFQVMLYLDWGMNVGESVEFGRLHNQLYPTVIEVDSIYPRPLVDELRQRGHNVTSSSPFGSLVRLTVRIDMKRSFRHQPRGRGYSSSIKGGKCNMG